MPLFPFKAAPARALIGLACALLLNACASVPTDQALARFNQEQTDNSWLSRPQAQAGPSPLTDEQVKPLVQLRQAWLRAVAARHSLVYARQVQEASQASAELAQRMQAAGNFSKLDLAREQLQDAEARNQLALADNEAESSRAALVRGLGLGEAEAARFALQEQLPEPPPQPRPPPHASQAQARPLLGLPHAGAYLRESYASYRTAYAIAMRYHQELLPLRQAIADENLLRYNGMLMGVFELLAQTREHKSAVLAAVAADREFWLADAALQSTLAGNPLVSTNEAQP